MNDILQDLQSPRWWFSAFVVAVLVNFLVAYTKPVTDRTYRRVRVASVNRSSRRRSEYAERIARLTNDPHRQVLVSFHAVRFRQNALTSFILGMSFIGFSIMFAGRGWSWLAMAIALEELFSSLRLLYVASENDRSVYEAALPSFVEVKDLAMPKGRAGEGKE